jgi:cell division protein FtsB
LRCLPGPWVHTLNYATAEFAFEIGSGLLTEVRRLQSLLAERDKAIQDMKEEKDDLEKSVEGLRTGLRQQEQNAGQSPLCHSALEHYLD